MLPETIPQLIRLKGYLEQLTADVVDDPEEIMNELACDGIDLLDAVEDALACLQDEGTFVITVPDNRIGVQCKFCNAIKQPNRTGEWQELQTLEGNKVVPTGTFRCPDCIRCRIGE